MRNFLTATGGPRLAGVIIEKFAAEGAVGSNALGRKCIVSVAPSVIGCKVSFVPTDKQPPQYRVLKYPS